MKKKRKIIFSSILVGLLTFGLLGFTFYNILVRLNFIQTSNLYCIFVLIGVILGAFFGYIFPVFVELLSFGITLLIIVQAVWDTAYDIQNGFSESRVIAGSIAIFIFILNTFTGVFKVGTAKKQIRKLLGLN